MLSQQLLSRSEWQREVKRRDEFQCRGCGDRGDIQVYFLVPPSLGGRTLLSNGITLCSQCRTRKTTRPGSAEAEFRRVKYNVPLTQDLVADLNTVSMAVGRSMAEIMRELIADAVFDRVPKDLAKSHMNGDPVKRVGIWVSEPVFEKFQVACRKQNRTTGDVLRALLTDWLSHLRKGVG